MSFELPQLTASDAWKLTPATLAHKLSRGKWIPAEHLLYVSAIIAAAIARGNARIIVSMPPRHGKSELLTKYTPVYCLERHPDKHVMLASYGAELATDFGRQVRDIIVENTGGLLNIKLRADTKNVGRFLTPEGGGMFAVGVGGALTGRGADVLLIDDYIKNEEDAESPTIRQKIYNWFVSTAYTRLEPNGSVIIVATRWHLDDLIGRLTIQGQPGMDGIDDDIRDIITGSHESLQTVLGGSQEWEHIVIPAIAGEDDVIGRSVGEPLFPERYTIEALEKIKSVLGTYYWQALYQQAPIPRSATTAKAFEAVDIAPNERLMRVVRYWDFAAQAEAGDFTAGIKVAKDLNTGLYYILDVVRGQWSPGQVEAIVRQTAEADEYHVVQLIEQEPGSSGVFVVEQFCNKVLEGYAARGCKSTGDKFIRAQPMYAAAEANRIKMLRRPWNRLLTDEFLLFPDAPHDDQVDCLSGAFKELNNKRYGSVVFGRQVKEAAGIAIRPIGAINTGTTFGREVKHGIRVVK